MSDSRKKKAMDYLLNRLDKIDLKYKSQSRKNSQWKLAVEKTKRDLRGEDKDGNLAIALNTYHNYLGDLREAVKQTNRKSPALTSSRKEGGYLSVVIEMLPKYESELRAIADMPALTIHKGVKHLRDKIRADLKGTPRNNAVNALETLLIHHPVVMMLEKEKAEKEDRAIDRTESLEDKTTDKKIYNAPALIEKAISLLDSEFYTSRAWGLALLTGRRSVEIIYHAEFEYLTDNTVMFSGQAKKSVGTEDKPYPIPVLADSNMIINALKSFREMDSIRAFKSGTGSVDWNKDIKYSELSRRDLNKAINQRTNGVLNARAKKITGDDSEVFKNTRIIYAEYCKQNMRNLSPEWSKMADDAYLRSILGHDQLGEVKHYNQAEVRNDVDGNWLKIKESKSTREVPEKAPEQTKETATKDWKATAGLPAIFDTIKAIEEKTITISTGRKVKTANVISFHHDQLRHWCAENPTLKITQSAVEKNKGNTLESGTGTVNVRVNRGTFKAWVQAAGADAVAAYNEGKE